MKIAVVVAFVAATAIGQVVVLSGASPGIISMNAEAVASDFSSQSRKSALGCRKQDGFVAIDIGRHRFHVPRNILGSVVLANGQYDRSWHCEDVAALKARSFHIFISRNAGDTFWESWARELPTTIEIAAHGRIVRYSSDAMAQRRSAEPIERDVLGFDAVREKALTYYDASPLGIFGYGQQKLVFQCSGTNLSIGRSCRVSYRYDDLIDVVYRFQEQRFPQDRWIKLDSRVREFLASLIQ